MHNRYLIFAFDQYYPEGGLDDIANSFETLEEVRDFLEQAYKADITVRVRTVWKKGIEYDVTEEVTDVFGPEFIQVYDIEARKEVQVGFAKPLAGSKVLSQVPHDV